MSRPTRGLRALLLALALVTGCAPATEAPPTEPSPGQPAASSGPTDADTSAGPPAPAPPPPPPPREGTCHRLSYASALAPTAEGHDVACSKPHTAQTFHVARFDRVVGGRLLAVDAAALQQRIAVTCPDQLAGFVGGTEEQRRLSMLRTVWFTPTVEQSDAGADWYRCDVIAVTGRERLLPLIGPVRGVLDTAAGIDRYGMCGTAEPGTDGFRRVACAEPHRWRALRTVDLGGGDYPGLNRVQTAGADPCRAAARSRAADPLDFHWGYEWPTAEQWRHGQTYGLCWAPTAG